MSLGANAAEQQEDNGVLPSLLAIVAHPDDEALVCGGVLAQHAESGARTAVVTATWASDSARAGELAASGRARASV